VRRRQFLEGAAGSAILAFTGMCTAAQPSTMTQAGTASAASAGAELTLFLAGDVMTGRGIDQVLPHPSGPRLYESYVKSARDYVTLAERVNGPLPQPVAFAYIWGDALAALDRLRPDARIVNLETAVTVSDDAWPGKGIHYRMNPANVACLTVARLDCCVLANNHAMDWGRRGLAETLATLRGAGLRAAGAGADRTQAQAPAVVDAAGKARLLVFAYCTPSSGVPAGWEATAALSGVNLLPDLSAASAQAVGRNVQQHRRPGDVVVVSIHWGGNWGYEIPAAERAFAHRIVDDAGVDLVHGHSSHHPKGIEVYRDRLILHGCGDLIDDYEGIGGHEAYRPDLRLLYFPTLDAATGRLSRLVLVPMRMRRFRLQRAAADDIEWLAAMEDREGRRLGTRIEPGADGTLTLRWQ
jgi:poly-gamma-glutamate capsule biosynthesis protein CapA/YwtB (metallophosphatase superfamily)